MNVPRPTLLRRWPHRGRLAVALTLLAAGVLGTTTAQASRGSSLRSQSADLPSLILSREQQVATLQEQVTQLQAQVTRLTELSNDPVVAEQSRRIAQLSPAAQLTPVSGPGVSVDLDDAPATRAMDPGVDPNTLVVHQQDVQAVVNALWVGGATGVAVMGQRLAATSSLRCVGATLHLHGRVYSPPFRISAVGDQAALVRALDLDPQLAIYREFVQLDGLGYTMTRHAELRLPGYTGPTQLSHAEAAT